MKDLIQIFILTHNRPQLVKLSVDSVLSQDYVSIEIVISDNSTNNDTEKALMDTCSANSKLRYVKRSPSMSAIDHLNSILGEVTSRYFMMFHDDDLMHPNMVSSLSKIMNMDASIAAVGSNACIIKNDKKRGTMRSRTKGISTFENSSDFIYTYLNNVGCAPFPSYLYRTTFITNTRFDLSLGGKYCDVSFLMSLSNKGKILLINEPLMDYYFHKGQDSAVDSFKDRTKLIQYISKTTRHKLSDPEIKAFRLLNIYGEIKKRIYNDITKINITRYLNLIFIAYKYSPSKLFPRLVYFLPRIIFNKIKSYDYSQNNNT